MGIDGYVGTSMDGMEMLTTTLGGKETWTIANSTQLEHSFHLHDVAFQIIEVNGETPTGVDLGRKDTVEVIGTAMMQFTDYADSDYMYMLHCHFVQHEDKRMMAALMVTES